MPSNSESETKRGLPAYAVLGAAIIGLAYVGLILDVRLIGIYFTPIVWTGYICFVDGLLWQRSGASLLTSRRNEALWMLPWSVLCWLIFEGYNLYLQNWKYVGLPDEVWLRVIGYVWSFATIFPAIIVTAEFLESVMPDLKFRFSFQLSRTTSLVLVAAGTMMLLFPLAVEQRLASKLFALVWIGFVFLLDPINDWASRFSVFRQLSTGKAKKIATLFAAGLCCGLLWEFWNYWAAAKWNYTVPISFAGPKIFEMPLLGYLGFLPFAVECYVMNEFLYVLLPHISRGKP